MPTEVSKVSRYQWSNNKPWIKDGKTTRCLK